MTLKKTSCNLAASRWRQSHHVFFFGNRKRSKKKPVVLTMKEKAVGIDLESSGEFASVERMLATTDANKFSPYLQTGAAELGAKRRGGCERAEN